MGSEIMFRDAGAPTDPDSNLLFRWENTINTPIVGAEYLDDGEAIADVYTIAATSGSSVNVTAADPKNEVEGTGLGVTADNTTWNYGVVPGCRFQFSSSLANGWTGVASIGALMAVNGSTSPRFNVGIVEAGTTSTQRRVAAVNVGDEDSSNTAVYALPGYFLADSARGWIKELRQHTDPARHAAATAGTLTITYGGYTVGTPDTVDVYVNAVKTIEDAKLDGQTLYQFGSGNGYIDAVDGFLGMGLVLANDPGDPSALTHTYKVRTGSEWVQFAPDVTGSPGTWQAGPLTLTQSGQSAGTILAGGYAYFWFRVNLPSSASPGDRRLVTLRARGLTV